MRFLILAVAVATSLVGCGVAPTTSSIKARATRAQAVQPQAAQLQPAADTPVNFQRDAFDLRGSFQVKFKGLGGGYKTLATREDVDEIRVTLTSPNLLKPLVKEVDGDDLYASEIALKFEKVPAGEIGVKVEVLDDNKFLIGTRETTAEVKVGELTVLELSVQLDAKAGVGGIGGSIEILDPEPEATPVIEPSPEPATAALDKLDRALFSKPHAEITVENPNAFAVETEVRVDFFNGETLKGSEDASVELEAGASKTIRIKSPAYFVDSAKATVLSTELGD